MLVFPQLSTGAAAQYPIRCQLSQRTIQCAMEDGTTISLADRAANYLRWRIAFQDLSDDETRALCSFFAATQGNLLPFLFLDPTANLLLCSEDYSQQVWNNGGLTFDVAIVDPLGGTHAARAHNDAARDLTISQLTQVPGLAQVCFSVYLRAAAASTVLLTRTAGTQSQVAQAAVSDTWQRFYLSGSLPGVCDVSQFAITVAAGTSLELFGPQLDAQMTPSTYITAGGGNSGVYANARFDIKQLDAIVTGLNRNACVVIVRCNLPTGE